MQTLTLAPLFLMIPVPDGTLRVREARCRTPGLHAPCPGQSTPTSSQGRQAGPPSREPAGGGGGEAGMAGSGPRISWGLSAARPPVAVAKCQLQFCCIHQEMPTFSCLRGLIRGQGCWETLASYRIEPTLAMRSGSRGPRCSPELPKTSRPHQNLPTDADSSFIHNRRNLKAPETSFSVCVER